MVLLVLAALFFVVARRVGAFKPLPRLRRIDSHESPQSIRSTKRYSTITYSAVRPTRKAISSGSSRTRTLSAPPRLMLRE